MPAWGWPNGWNSPYKAATTAFPMSALANHPFVKMNGLGNEIVVVDMRGETGAVSAADGASRGPDNARLPFASHDPRGGAEHRAIIAEAKPIMRRSSLKPG